MIGSKRLPLDGISLIHLDAHSDLSVPPMLADSVFLKEELYRFVTFIFLLSSSKISMNIGNVC